MTFSPEQFSTTAVHGGLAPDPATGAVLTPIYQSTTYHQQAVGVHKGFTYSRAANPDSLGARSCAGGAREHASRGLLRHRHGRNLDAISRDAESGRSRRRVGRCLRRHGAVVPAGASELRRRRRLRRYLGRGRCRSSDSPEHEAGVHRDAGESHAEADRHRCHRQRRARRRSEARGRQHVPHASLHSGRSISAPTSRCSRPPSTSKATTPPSAAPSPRATKPCSSGCASCARRSAVSSLRRNPG